MGLAYETFPRPLCLGKIHLILCRQRKCRHGWARHGVGHLLPFREWSPAWAAGWCATAFQMCPFKTDAALPHTSLKWFSWLWWNYSRFHTFLTESINWPVCVAFPLFGNYFKRAQIRWISTGRHICSVVLINTSILWCTVSGLQEAVAQSLAAVPSACQSSWKCWGALLHTQQTLQHRAGQIAGLPSAAFGSHRRQEPVQGFCGDCLQSSAWNSF